MRAYLTLFRRAIASFFADKCTSFAAAISYYALFSLFPLVLVVLSFLGFFIHSPSQRESAVSVIFRLLGQGVDRNALYTQVNAFAGGRGGLGLASLVVGLWSASAVFSAIRTGLNAAWDVTKLQSYVERKALDLVMVLLLGLLLLLLLAATAFLTAVQHYSSHLFGNQIGLLTHLLIALLPLLVPAAISFVAFALMYYFVPHVELRPGDVWLGALVAALLFEAVQMGFGFYVSKFAHYDLVYGSLGAVITFLFFVYLSANILLLGGEITKQYADMRAGRESETMPGAGGIPADRAMSGRQGGSGAIR